MIAEQRDRMMVTAQCHFPPDIGYTTKLSAALVRASSLLKTQHWQSNPQRGVLRDPSEKTVLYADHRVIQLQTLGCGPWSKGMDKHIEVFVEMLDAFSVSQCSKLRLELLAFLRLGMTHSEIVDLFFGSFLGQRDALRGLGIEPIDGVARIDGNKDDTIVHAMVTPMKAEEVGEEVRRLPNIDAFREHPLFDVSLKEWYDRLVEDSLQVRIETHRDEVQMNVYELGRFFRSATQFAEQLADNLVKTLKSLPLDK